DHARQYVRYRGGPNPGPQHTGREVQICDPIVYFAEGRNVLVSDAQIQGEISTHFPVVLSEHVPGIATKMVAILPQLHLCLLRQREQKIGEVITAVYAREYKSTASIVTRFRVELDSLEIAAPSPGMLAVVPNQFFRKGEGLIS